MNKKAKHTSDESVEDKNNLGEELDNVAAAAANESDENTCDKEQEACDNPEKDDEQSVVEKLQAALEDQKDKYLRLSAEFDNYRKRTLREKSELILNGGEKSISSILPVIDDLERAIQSMENTDDVKAVKEGVDLIYDKLMKTLEKNGVTVIDTVKKPLDTDFHEAIAVIPAPSEDLKGKIIDCVQTGYMLNDKVIRHSKVVVGE